MHSFFNHFFSEFSIILWVLNVGIKSFSFEAQHFYSNYYVRGIQNKNRVACFDWLIFHYFLQLIFRLKPHWHQLQKIMKNLPIKNHATLFLSWMPFSAASFNIRIPKLSFVEYDGFLSSSKQLLYSCTKLAWPTN